MPIALASSVIKGFDLVETVDEAFEKNIDSVQLYINDSIIDRDYREQLINAIHSQHISNVIIHLPDVTKITGDQAIATQLLVDGIKRPPLKNTRLDGIKVEIEVVGLIHYEDDIPIVFPSLTTKAGNRTRPLLSINIPKFDNLVVGVENSVTGSFNPRHVWNAFTFARANGIPFVFDIGRIMYPIVTKLGKNDFGNDIKDLYINDDIKMEVYAFIEQMLSFMDPKIDILHVSGKTEWAKFRDYACALGAEGDITIPLIPSLKKFLEAGGKVVLEHEDLQQAVDSIRVFEG